MRCGWDRRKKIGRYGKKSKKANNQRVKAKSKKIPERSGKIEDIDENTFDLDMLTEKLFPKRQDTKEYPLQVQWSVDQLARKLTYLKLKVHTVSDNLTVYEAAAKDEENILRLEMKRTARSLPWCL